MTFTLLVGVLLSDQVAPDAGNLVVWPGSHLLYAEHFRRHGGRSLLDGLPEVPLPEPEPVLGRAGDLVLCHYQLAHAGGPNLSPHVRYSVYFRVKAAGHDSRRWECLEHPWREWTALASRGSAAIREA
jgi:ectoine hydroxylase-related dioxygenase (phytanoyl-CoA dioxygenase family)